MQKEKRQLAGDVVTEKSGYCRVFRNVQFLLVFLSYLVNSFGDWLNYVAAIKLLGDITPSSLHATYVSLFMVTRLLPPLIFVPFTGSIADAYDKRAVMGITSVASALVVCGFLLVEATSKVWLFYLVAFLQQTFFAQYDPTRRALVPAVVSAEELKFATTADAYAWSIMMGIGATAGGGLLIKFGLDANFLIDAGTFVVSAILIMLTSPVPLKCEARGEGDQAASSADEASATNVFQNVRRGAKYIFGREQRSLLCILFVKASAALSWGLAELLEVQYSNMSSMHRFGGDASTLGLIYASTACGCILGPLGFGALSAVGGASEVAAMKRTLISAFGLSAVSALVLWLSRGAVSMLASSFLRACASSAIWIYSTLLVQRNADPRFFGRIFAAEMCFFTASKGLGLLFGAALFDLLNFSSKICALFMMVVSIVVFFVWAAVFLLEEFNGRDEGEAKDTESKERSPLLPGAGKSDSNEESSIDI